MNTTDLFELLSGWTWDVLETAYLQQVRFGEDAVTSMLAVAINRFGPRGARVVDVRTREPSDGADVEVWFVQEHERACGFSVQAKMVDAGPKCGGSYRHLDHPSGSTYKQVDRLISTSARIGTTPVYAFYNHQLALPEYGIGLRGCGRGARHDQLGCTVVHAFVVRSALRGGRRGWKRMARFHGPSGPAIPLRCSVCTCAPAKRPPRRWLRAPWLDRLPNRVRTLLDVGRTIGDEARDPRWDDPPYEDMRRARLLEVEGRPKFLVVVPFLATSDSLAWPPPGRSSTTI